MVSSKCQVADNRPRKAVPREPTDTMGDAGYLILTNKPDDCGYKCVTHIAEAVWRAMYDAAPVLATAPAEPPKEGEVAALIYSLDQARSEVYRCGHHECARICADAGAMLARLSTPPAEVAAVIVRLQHWKHTVPTTRERAEMIEDMRAAIELLESAAAPVPAREWIPVGEPAKNGRYHIYMKQWPDEVPQADFRDGRWFAPGDAYEYGESFGITHYRALPPPPAADKPT